MRELKDFLQDFGLQISTDEQEVGFDGAFQRGIRAFSDGLQPSSLSYYEREGYKAAQEALRLLIKRREESLGRYRQIEFKFD